MLIADARWIGTHGIGRFAREVLGRLSPHGRIESGPSPSSPLDPLWLSWQLRDRKISLFFSPGYNFPIFCRVPYVITIHDLIHLRFAPRAARLTRMYYETVIRPAARAAKRILTVSEHSRLEIIKWCGVSEDRVVAVGNGVSRDFTPNGPKTEFGFPYVLYVSNRRPHKNLDRLLQAFAKLGDQSVKLVLSGAVDEPTQTRIETAGASGRVAFAGQVPERDLPALYRGAVMLVSPSLTEGFGLPALEAMACGTPVVVSNAGSFPELVNGAGEFVDPEDVSDIRRGIERVLGDPGLRTSLRTRGIERAAQFSWDQVASRVTAILNGAA
jgi:glycosyltransferase involved in cell wall biosynthesis